LIFKKSIMKGAYPNPVQDPMKDCDLFPIAIGRPIKTINIYI